EEQHKKRIVLQRQPEILVVPQLAIVVEANKSWIAEAGPVIQAVARRVDDRPQDKHGVDDQAGQDKQIGVVWADVWRGVEASVPKRFFHVGTRPGWCRSLKFLCPNKGGWPVGKPPSLRQSRAMALASGLIVRLNILDKLFRRDLTRHHLLDVSGEIRHGPVEIVPDSVLAADGV